MFLGAGGGVGRGVHVCSGAVVDRIMHQALPIAVVSFVFYLFF